MSETTKVIINDVIQEIITVAHMAGQADAGIDPSYSSALAYCMSIFPTPAEVKPLS